MKKNVYASVVSAGVDVHYPLSTVAMVDARCRVVRRERLEHRNRAALRACLPQGPAGMTVVLEASFGWAG